MSTGMRFATDAMTRGIKSVLGPNASVVYMHVPVEGRIEVRVSAPDEASSPAVIAMLSASEVAIAMARLQDERGLDRRMEAMGRDIGMSLLGRIA